MLKTGPDKFAVEVGRSSLAGGIGIPSEVAARAYSPEKPYYRLTHRSAS